MMICVVTSSCLPVIPEHWQFVFAVVGMVWLSMLIRSVT